MPKNKVVWPHKEYPIGAVIVRSTGYTYVKTREGLVAEHRLKMELREGRSLVRAKDQQGYAEKVMHLDNTIRGTEEFADPKNLTIIKVRTTKWIPIMGHVLKLPKALKLKSHTSVFVK